MDLLKLKSEMMSLRANTAGLLDSFDGVIDALDRCAKLLQETDRTPDPRPDPPRNWPEDSPGRMQKLAATMNAATSEEVRGLVAPAVARSHLTDHIQNDSTLNTPGMSSEPVSTPAPAVKRGRRPKAKPIPAWKPMPVPVEKGNPVTGVATCPMTVMPVSPQVETPPVYRETRPRFDGQDATPINGKMISCRD